MNTYKTDVAIIGGGLNGPLLALSLAKNGIKSIIIDATPTNIIKETNFDGRAYALSPTSQAMLQVLDIWPEIESTATPVLDILASDGTVSGGASPLFLHFDHKDLGQPMSHMVEDQILRAILRDRISLADDITLLSPLKVTGVSSNIGHTELQLENGHTIQAALAVACDGSHSPTAKSAGIKTVGWSYQQTAIVATVHHEKPHHNVAHEYFLPTGPFAILPMQGNTSSIVWTETTENAQNLLAMNDNDFLYEMSLRFGPFLGPLSIVGPKFSYPLNLSLASEFVKPRLALIGDSAHRVHPLAGQGLNMGIKDIAALTEVLTDAARLGLDIGAIDILKNYERWRRFDTVTLSLGMDALNTIFSNDIPLVRAGRDAGISFVSKTEAARKFFIRMAAGTAGDVPLMLQGKSI